MPSGPMGPVKGLSPRYFQELDTNKVPKTSPAQSQDLDDEGRKRSVWWHAFLIETGNIELGDTKHV